MCAQNLLAQSYKEFMIGNYMIIFSFLENVFEIKKRWSQSSLTHGGQKPLDNLGPHINNSKFPWHNEIFNWMIKFHVNP